MKSTVVDLDLVAYNDIVRTLEENQGPDAIADLNKEIAESIRAAAKDVGVILDRKNFKGTGDGGIVFFDHAEKAHRFAEKIVAATRERNATKTKFVAKRFFRIGASTGEIAARDGDFAGMTIATAVRLEGAAKPGSLLADVSTVAALPSELQALYEAERTVEGKRDERIPAREVVFDPAAAEEVSRNIPSKADIQKLRGGSRAEIVNLLSRTDEAALARVIFIIEMVIEEQPSQNVTLAERRTALLRWASVSSERIERLAEALRDFGSGDKA